MSTAVDFQAFGRPLEMVSPFKYLGRVLTELDNNWSAVVENMREVWIWWSWIS